ncbi:SIS domain-containing protein [soil metagenome]
MARLSGLPAGLGHLAALAGPLRKLEEEVERIDRWGRTLGRALLEGRRLLAVGNGGSAAQAQHLTAELVGRYCDDRIPFSAIALHADTSSLTAIANDYGVHEAFARQVRAHGRPGDILIALSTSGSSANVVSSVAAAQGLGLTAWGITGPGPNPLADLCDEALSIESPAKPTVQEVHLVVVHLLCAAIDIEVGCSSPRDGALT